jgi:signal transduction histidine kinase/DNA-binding response OmpR family regulator
MNSSEIKDETSFAPILPFSHGNDDGDGHDDDDDGGGDDGGDGNCENDCNDTGDYDYDRVGVRVGDQDDTTSRTNNRKSYHRSKRRVGENKNLPISHFEINCSPAPLTGDEKSYYYQTRMRRQLQKQQQPPLSNNNDNDNNNDNNKQIAQHYSGRAVTTNDPPTSTSTETDKGTSPCGDDPVPGTDKQENRNHHPNNHDGIGGVTEIDDDRNDDGNDVGNDNDDTSCSSLVDSSMAGADSEDNTISTSIPESSNVDSSNNSTSNVTNVTPPDTLVSFNSTRSACSSVSVSRGEEHITYRMKKYGLFNLHEMKRKQQQRRATRNNNGKGGNGFSNNNNNNSTITANSQHQAVSVNSGLTDGMMTMESSGLSNPSKGAGAAGVFGGGGAGVPTKIRTAPLHVQMAVEDVHRWLFTEGGHFEDVQTLMTQYSLYVRDNLGIPLDRLYYGGVGLHPKLTAYLWKWEAYGEFSHSEMPPEIFARRNEIFSPDEPFCVLEQGRADHVRIKDTDSYIPPDTSKWFRGGNFKDYFALPDIHRGVSKGGLAWSTKNRGGFEDDDIQFFRMTHAALTTIMRLHTNDLVLNTLTDRMESEIDDRTNELAIANRKLEEANEEISKHASKQLEHFACMSHEIRTPLNCIVGLSSLLLENENLNDDLLDTIHMVYNSADLVQGVVNDVLDYAKIESGHFELDVRPSDLQTTLKGVVHSISNKLQEKNVDIRTSYCGKLGKTMTTDSRRLQQILYNILGNAAKFSREGTTIDFKVRVVVAPEGAPESENESINSNSKRNSHINSNSSNSLKHRIQFSIKDFGKGIEEKNFEKIFQPFSQASKETQTIYGGTGLGLSITKNLVARLGGEISIRSEIDKFTEFIVDLPYEDEMVDASVYKEKMSETSIVILDPSERLATSPSLEEDDFVPFPAGVSTDYDLTIMRCSSWGELESKLGLRANIREYYVILAHEDIEERQGILNVKKLVRKERCSWFTFGSDTSSLVQRQHHFKTLTGIFPSALIDSISEVANAHRDIGPSASSVGSLESKSSSSMQDKAEEQPKQEQEQPKDDASSSASDTPNHDEFSLAVETTSISSSRPRSSSSKSNKKFATKYPPRALKVLIVDDNVINQKVLDRILKRLGVTDIAIVNDGKKAVDLTETMRFDCIFMDMEMPVMGGLEACKLIVDRDKDAARVAFVTARDIGDIREKANAAGAYGYISKPLKMTDIHEFLKILENLKKDASHDFSNQSDATTTITMTTEDTSTVAYAKKRPTPPKKKKRITKLYPPRNIKVLVAEDNLINQKVLDRILKRLGVTDVTIVDNGKKAVDASETTKFDCILMDMQMPIMDGLEACKIIVKGDKEKGDVPKVVFVTAHALVEFKEKALAAGAFDFITKPFKMEDIDNVLKILEATKSEHSGSGPPDKPESPTQAGSGTLDSTVDSTVDMGSTSSEESSNAKPTKMPKLDHSLSD